MPTLSDRLRAVAFCQRCLLSAGEPPDVGFSRDTIRLARRQVPENRTDGPECVSCMRGVQFAARASPAYAIP